MIEITIKLSARPDGSVEVDYRTAPFDPKKQPDSVGHLFVALSMHINTCMQSHGLPHFDCLKPLQNPRRPPADTH